MQLLEFLRSAAPEGIEARHAAFPAYMSLSNIRNELWGTCKPAL